MKKEFIPWILCCLFVLALGQFVATKASKEISISGRTVGELHDFPHRATKLQNFSYDIVVSHCRTSLEWLGPELLALDKEFFQLRKIFIYSKCDVQPKGLDLIDQDVIFELSLSNVGRCDHTYAYHVANYYHDMASVVFFLKDSYHSSAADLKEGQLSLSKLFSKVKYHHFACARQPQNDVSVWHVRQQLWQFRLPLYVTSEDRVKGLNVYDVKDDRMEWRSNASLSMCRFLREALTKDEMEENSQRRLVPSCYGGSFAADSAMIRSIEQPTWQRFERLLSRWENIEEGHFMERTWATLLTPPPNTGQISLLTTSAEGLSTRGSLLGESYLGSLQICRTCPTVPLNPLVRPQSFFGVPDINQFYRKKPQVLIFSHWLKADGAPRYALAVGIEFKKMGYQVMIVSPYKGGFEEDIVKEGIHVKIIPEFDPRNKKFTMKTFFAWLRYYRLQPTFVIWNTVLWAPLLDTYSKYRRIYPQMIWVLHEFDIGNDSAWAAEFPVLANPRKRKKILGNLDAVVFVADRQKAVWTDSDMGNSYVVPGYPRTATSDSLITRQALGIPDDAFVISMTGTFCRRKRQHWIFKAIDEFQGANIHLQFLLIGAPNAYGSSEDGYADDIIAKANTSKYIDHVTLVPFTPEPFPYLQLANLHVSASSEEAYPLNLIEAMSVGIPVVATDAGGTRELYPSQTTEQFLVKDIDNVHQFINKLMLATILHQSGSLKAFGLEFQKSIEQRKQIFSDHWRDIVHRLEIEITDSIACKFLN